VYVTIFLKARHEEVVAYRVQMFAAFFSELFVKSSQGEEKDKRKES
jgi:hypothetical protein